MESKDNKIIFGFLRLRNILNPRRKELQDNSLPLKATAIVRELHVYGKLIDIGQKNDNGYYQHKGLGLRLMEEAEKISKEEFCVNKISVISAVGTREYYKKIGYIQNGPYVTKILV
jgi:elongator complex protein 3